MRSLLTALALTIAIPATALPAAACGGGEVHTTTISAERHVAIGQIGGTLRRDDAGLLAMFVSYPEIDGAWSGLYGIFVQLEDDRLSRALARDHARWTKKLGGSPVVTVTVTRTGDTENDRVWRLVSYRLGAHHR
jgi:hypothetical protein